MGVRIRDNKRPLLSTCVADLYLCMPAGGESAVDYVIDYAAELARVLRSGMMMIESKDQI